ncbi:hypothetical protein B0H17DRAFT_1155275 [Mycena rosella]|uniref:Uncharacterized protein n=1 Tax=Mycena rosella TaxID=1033263 RepID=A0AAD7AX88_MYCRO|nr:hypothetical protein B0H17DRAFT_1155275 [Mycena rosella]
MFSTLLAPWAAGAILMVGASTAQAIPITLKACQAQNLQGPCTDVTFTLNSCTTIPRAYNDLARSVAAPSALFKIECILYEENWINPGQSQETTLLDLIPGIFVPPGINVGDDLKNSVSNFKCSYIF